MQVFSKVFGLSCVMVLGFSAELGMADSSPDPKAILSDWLQQTLRPDLVLETCQARAEKHLYLAALADPSLSDPSAQTNVLNMTLLECVYGFDWVARSFCFNQSTGCTPFQLQLPTAEQVNEVMQARQSQPVTSSTTATANIIYGVAS